VPVTRRDAPLPAPQRHARIVRQREIVVRREVHEPGGRDAARAPEPLRLQRVQLRRERGVARCRGRRSVRPRRDAVDEDRFAFKVADRLGDRVARPAVEEDAPAGRIARLLQPRDAPVAERPRGDIPRHVAGIVGHADFADDVRRAQHLGRQHDGLAVVVLHAGVPARRTGRVHVCRAHAARAVRFEPFERVRVEQHRPAQRVRLAEARADLVRARETRRPEDLVDPAPAGGGRIDGLGRDRQRRQVRRFRRERFDLDVDGIGAATLVPGGAAVERGDHGRHVRRRHDPFRAGDVHAAKRRAHLDAAERPGHASS